MPTLFSRIISGELPGSFIWRDEVCVVFMTINPITTGHALVVPVVEVDQWTDLNEGILTHLLQVAQRIGAAQKSVYGCHRIGLVIAGYEIPHCHVHVIPTNSMAELSFENTSAQVPQEILAEQAALITAALNIK